MKSAARLIPRHRKHRLRDPGATHRRHGAGAAVVHGAAAEGQQPVVGHRGQLEDVLLRESDVKMAEKTLESGGK